ncbi:MauE/DoxX family redox-associated membrane protein [Litoribacter populi]|uniref:MauE/DoxX family redox-associated membrane protein n=1 Tax=Litoribacter populi TaxID=2598460 RepID=UPI00163D44A5|nr:MauE/DoxX family redox-associated membrane protein [Litoribacter populi]
MEKRIKITPIKKSIIQEATSLILVLLLTYTAFSKWIDWTGTKNALYNQVFPTRMAEGLLWGLPVVELAVAAMLVCNKWRYYGLWISVLLMLCFTIYVGLVMTGIFGRIPCSCGGVMGSLGWGEHLAVNIGFLLIAMIGLHFHRKIDNEFGQPSLEGGKPAKEAGLEK